MFSRKELIGYVIVGVGGTIIDFSLFFLLIKGGSPAIAAQWSAALTGCLHNYLWHHFRVFDHNQATQKTFLFSTIVSIAGILLSGPLFTSISLFIPSLLVSKIVLLAIMAGITFVIRKKFIFINS